MSVFSKVYQQLQVLYRMEGLSGICSNLGASRLILLDGSKRDLYRRVRLNISQEDVTFALREST